MQLIIYKKDGGQILQVLSYRSLPKNFNLDNHNFNFDIDHIIVDDNLFVDVRRDCINNQQISSNNFQKNIDNIISDIVYENKRKHVGIMTPFRQQCGIAKYSEDLATELKNKLTIFCERNDDTNTNLNIIPCWGKNDASYYELLTEIKKNNIDVFHVQYNHGLMNAGEIKKVADELRKNDIYTIMTLHSCKGGVEVFADHFDKLIIHSNLGIRDFIDLGVKKDKMEFIRIGSNPSISISMQDARFQLNLDQTRPIIATFGFLLPQKGIKEALQAIYILKDKYPDILFIACCALHTVQNKDLSQQYYEQCKKTIDQLQIQNNVMMITDFLSFEDVYKYLCSANIISLAYTSAAEQVTSSAGRTALASLRPVITSTVEIFDDLTNVVPKVKPRDYKQLANVIQKLLTSEDECENIIRRTTKFLEQTSWKNIAKEHSVVYKAFGNYSLDIEGQVYSYFSASIVNRRLACALDELGVEVSLHSVNMAENESYVLSDNSKKLMNTQRTKQYCVRHQYPPKFSNIDSKVKIVYLPVETTSVPDKKNAILESEDWITNINKYIDYVWVYTTHGKQVLEKYGLKNVYVIPCGYDEHLFNENYAKKIDFSKIKDSYTQLSIDMNDAFIFMFCGHAQKRKNFETILSAYLNEFDVFDNVVLIIKSYDGGEVHKIILDELEKANKTNLPKYLYIYEDSLPEMMPQYYYTADCMVQCSRAEGFGLPILEAMVMGTPSIVINWGGPKDFVTSDNSFFVPYTLIESDYHAQSKDHLSYWADVKVQDLQNVMRFAFQNKKVCEKKGKIGKEDTKFWTSKYCAMSVIDFIKDVEKNEY